MAPTPYLVRQFAFPQGTVLRPRTRPNPAELRNRISAAKTSGFAAWFAPPAIPPTPSTAAINAMIRNVIAQPNMEHLIRSVSSGANVVAARMFRLADAAARDDSANST